MAFADPQTITINAVPHTLARTGFGPDNGLFREDDTENKLSISHTYGKRVRRLARLDNQVTTTDLLDPSINTLYTMACHLVVDVPTVGYSIASQKQVVDGFVAWLSASSGANITKLLGGEA
jgi:hypothetical protein